MNIKIRNASIDDAIVANKFLTKLIVDEKQYDKNINNNCIIETLYENIINNNNNCVLIAQLDDGTAIGYLYGYLLDGGDAYIKPVTQLEAMFVDETHRGSKVGSMLVDQFKEWSLEKGAKFIELKVCNKNNVAIRLYEKQGFKNIKSTMIVEIGE